MEPKDLGPILRLNARWEHVTSPLEVDALDRLHEEAAYHRVFVDGVRIAGFLLALGPGVDYESPNYRWFDAAGGEYLYIDRIVVESDYQRAGVGDALYDDLIAFAAERGIPRLTCEVDIEPHNKASDAFHARRGFVEVGTQWVEGGAKRVSLREYVLG